MWQQIIKYSALLSVFIIYRQQTTEVGSFPANNFGLYDLHGNVWEWCADDWHETYQNAPQDGSIWIDGDDQHSPMRGGSWAALPFHCCCATRNKVQRNNRSLYNGFRVVYNFKKSNTFFQIITKNNG